VLNGKVVFIHAEKHICYNGNKRTGVIKMEHFPHIPDYAEQYLLTLKKDGLKDSTIRRYYYDLNDYFAWMRVNFEEDHLQKLSSLTKKDTKEYYQFLSMQRKYSASTLTRVETVLKRLGVYLVKYGQMAANPFHMERTIHSAELSDEDFAKSGEIEKLFSVISSDEGLTENQLKHRHLLVPRNKAILRLLVFHGLSMQELNQISMKDVSPHHKELHLPTRTCSLTKVDQSILMDYLQSVPEPVRPRARTKDPLFAAFDYQRGTYRWDYEQSSPKPLTIIAIQKMLRQEIRRGGLRNGLSAQHFRRSYILSLIQEGADDDELKQRLGLKALLSLKRYRSYAQLQI
jgi:site-specific recombinase XerD